MSINIVNPSKSKKLILLSRESELRNVKDRYLDEKHRNLAYKIVDALFDIEDNDIVTHRHIELFITDMEMTSWRSTSKGAVLLCLLIHHKGVLEAIHKLLQHPKWQMRFHVIAELDRLAVNKTSSELLKIALKDRSS